MNPLELVQKLYEGDTDLDALRDELDEGSREELQQLIEARDALSELPRQKPSAGVVDAVVASAVKKGTEVRRPLLTLLVFNRTVQRLAAAAIVVVAVGVGYLTLRTEGPLSVGNDDLANVSPKQSVVSEKPQAAVQNDEAGATIAEEMKAASPAAQSLRRDAAEPVATQKAARAKVSSARPAPSDSRDLMLADAESANYDTVVSTEGEDAADPLKWDGEEQALRTLFWQVRALDGRSPDDKWEEAVPLEGSFEHLQKQQPNGDRWIQAGSQR